MYVCMIDQGDWVTYVYIRAIYDITTANYSRRVPLSYVDFKAKIGIRNGCQIEIIL